MKVPPYEQVGARWLLEEKTRLLADAPPLETIPQVAMACDKIDGKVLIFCPFTRCAEWMETWKRRSTQRAKDIALIDTAKSVPNKPVIVCPYYLATSVKALLAERTNAVVVLDQVHLLGWHQEAALEIAKKAKQHVWLLSPVPIGRNPTTMFPWLYALGWTNMKRDEFANHYCTFSRQEMRGVTYRVVTGPKNTAHLRQMLAPHLLRRDRSDVKDIPSLLLVHVPVLPTEPDVERYDLHPGKGKARFSDSAYAGACKAGTAVEMIRDELRAGVHDRITVLAEFPATLDILREGLAAFKRSAFIVPLDSPMDAHRSSEIVVVETGHDPAVLTRALLAARAGGPTRVRFLTLSGDDLTIQQMIVVASMLEEPEQGLAS
jgi:hypothetical protein